MTSSRKMLSGEPAPAVENPVNFSPFIHEFFMVQVNGSLDMAYRDEAGKWRAAYQDDELSGDISVFE
jgi:hypothetical protein